MQIYLLLLCFDSCEPYFHDISCHILQCKFSPPKSLPCRSNLQAHEGPQLCFANRYRSKLAAIQIFLQIISSDKFNYRDIYLPGIIYIYKLSGDCPRWRVSVERMYKIFMIIALSKLFFFVMALKLFIA